MAGKIAWVNGLFRIWIVLALLWSGIVVGGYFYFRQTLPPLDRGSFLYVPEIDYVKPIASTWNTNCIAPHTQATVFDVGKYRFEKLKLTEVIVCERPSNDSLWKTSSNLATEFKKLEQLVLALAEEQAEQRRAEIYLAAKFAIFPSAVVLLIGALMIWAFRGFSAEKG